MGPEDILKAVLVGLAAYGYVHLLACFRWLTVAGTIMVIAMISHSFPFTLSNAVKWACIGVFLILAFALSRLWSPPTPPKRQARSKPTNRRTNAQKEIVIDGTNVLYWDGPPAEISTLRAVVDLLVSRGFVPFVFLDASSRHHLKDKSLNTAGFAKALGLPQSRVTVCPAGSEADAFILKFAKAEGLPVVSNDRFGDRAQQAKGVKLVKGVLVKGRPVFEGL